MYKAYKKNQFYATYSAADCRMCRSASLPFETVYEKGAALIAMCFLAVVVGAALSVWAIMFTIKGTHTPFSRVCCCYCSQ